MFMKVVLSPLTWIAIFGVALVFGYMHLSDQNTKLITEVQQSREVVQAKNDATTVIRQHYQRKQTRQTERDGVSTAIDNAKPGQAYDDALDEIARLQSAAPAPAPVDGSASKRLRDKQGDGVVKP